MSYPEILLTIRSILAAIVLLLLLWVALLHPKRQHPGLESLRRYRYAHRGWHDKPAIPEHSMAAFDCLGLIKDVLKGLFCCLRL